MSEINRLNTRNAAISAMLLDSENIKNFYRFIAQNPHINLHDACQIVIERPNATVCFSFDEWDAMGRRISKGRKGIAYYDYDGYKQYVFDVNDTHGDRRYLRPILPMKHLLVGLDELNITNYADDERSDYRKIHKGVQLYLKEQGELTGDDKKDGLKIEGIAYMLYCKTGFPKTAGIAFHGLPYSFKENTDFVKDLYILTDTIVEEIENAYQSRQQQPVKVIDDINEETISDEPTVSKPLIEQVSDLTEQIDDLTESIPVEQTKVQPEQDVKSVEQMDTSKLPPYYREYLKQERENPNRIIAIRVGDFYEFMNESAKTISQELDLTLTGRDVGLPERVPMCGVPFHATEKYFNKILANHELVVIEDYTKKSINIFPSEEEKQDERDKPELIEIEDNEPNPFDSEENDFIDDGYSEEDEQDSSEETSRDEDELAELEELIGEEQQVDKSKKVKRPAESTKKKENGIKDRKRKEKPQPTLLDLANPSQKKSRLEQIIEEELKRGSSFQDGKFRIFDKYNENPTVKTFVEFLKKEYGWGGHSGWGGICQEHSPKGLKIYLLGKQGEELENTFLKWPEVANRIADLIDDDNYLTEQDKKKYIEYRVEQNRLKEKAAEEQRQKNNLVKSVIVSASDERKQRILDEYAKTTQITEFGKFLFAEYGTNTESTDDYRVQYDAMGVWFTKYDTKGNTAFKVTLSWNEFAEKVCECIEDDNYIEAPEANEYDWDYLIDNAERGLSEITVSVGDVFLYKDKEVTIKELDSLYPGDVVIEYNEQTGNLKYAVTKNITEKELIQNGVRIKTATEQRISALVEYMVDYGTHNTEDGNSYLYFNDLPETEDFMSNNILRRLKLGEFEYGGYRFVPYREFNDKEKAMSLKEMTPYLSSDSGLGIAKSNIPYSEYDYDREDFYSASGNSKCDLFICKENGKIYVPTENELQIYNEKFNEEDKEIREFLTTVDNALADSEKPKIYYSFDRLKDENGLEYYQAFTMGDDGVIEPVFQDKLKTRQELNSRWKNLEVLFLPTQLVRITLEEMKTLSEKFNIENNKKIEENEMEDKDKYLTETPQGYKVLSIIKDRDDRNIAIIQRKNDFVVAARYDTSDGTWGQGTYDFPTVEAAEQYRGEHYGNAARQDNSKWVEINVSKNALIKRYDRSSHFRMPTTNKELQEYSYYLFNNRIKESRQLVDMQSDGRELCYKLLFESDDTVIIKNRNGDVREFTPQEFKELVGGTSNKDYESNFNKVKINLPREAIIGTYDKTTFIAMPTNNEKYKGYGYYVPNSVIEEDKESENGRINVSVGDNFKFTLKKGEEKKEITAEYLSDMVSGTNAEDYEREPTALDDYREQDGDEGDKKWFNVPFSEKAFIIEYDNVALYKMPKGEYEGKAYYLPHGMYKEKANGEVYLRIPEDFEIHLKGGADGEQIDLTAEQFIEALKGKTDEDYESKYRQPSEEAKKQFEKVEARLRKNVPEVMRNKPNWVIVRTRENMETGRLDKFLIDTHTGKFAESNNPETWTDFDTACKYAKENGGVALAYALDGKDNIACIDLDGCIEKNGDFSPLAKKVFDNCDGTYCEKSVSGKGLHFFGITKGADLRAFSKDGDMEYYQGGHFIAMTGDDYGNTELKSFDTPEMKAILESKLEKRTEWKGAGTGVEGLSLLDDREVLDKAFASKNGEKIRQLYNGRDLQNNHSNSDMSLMNYLAFWCNHDIDQMLRINATSGLFRADKPQSYYEHTAIKAVKGTPVYTPPKASNNKPSGNGNGSDKGGK